MNKHKFLISLLLIPIFSWGLIFLFSKYSNYKIEETTASFLHKMATGSPVLNSMVKIYTKKYPEYVPEKYTGPEYITQDTIEKCYLPLLTSTPFFNKDNDVERFFILRDDSQIYLVFTSKFRFFTPEELFLPGAIHDENFVRFIKDIKKL